MTFEIFHSKEELHSKIYTYVRGNNNQAWKISSNRSGLHAFTSPEIATQYAEKETQKDGIEYKVVDISLLVNEGVINRNSLIFKE